MAIDRELIEAIELMKEKRDEGFGVFYQHTHDYVYKRARFIMQNEEDALDLTQETYVQAYKGIASLEKAENVYAWLGAIAYRQGMRIFRERKELLVDEESEYVFEDIVSEDKDYSPEDATEAQATVDIVMSFIDELPELQRAAIVAFYYDGKKIDEIAEEAGCSSNTIKSRLNYAKKFLKDKVESHEKTCGYRLHSVTPFIIFSALGGILGGNAYTISAQASEVVLAGVSSATGVALSAGGGATTAGAIAGGASTVVSASAGATGAGAAISTGAAVAAKVGIGLGAKIAIGFTAVALAGGIAVGGTTLLSSSGERGSEQVSDNVNDNEAITPDMDDDNVIDSEQGSGVDGGDETLYPSVWEQGFEGYMQSGTSHIFITNDKYGYALSNETLIYVVDDQGEYAVVVNKNDAGERIYKSISGYALWGFVAKLTKEDGTFDLLDADGNIFGAGRGYSQVSVSRVNGEIAMVAKYTANDVASFDIYNQDRELIVEGYTGLNTVNGYDTIGSYTYVSGYRDDKTAAILVYDSDGKCVDTIEGKSTYDRLFDGKYIWDGTTMWDGEHNAVEVPIPTNLKDIGKVVLWDVYVKDDTLTSVHAAVTTAEGEEEHFNYSFDSQLNIRNDVKDPTFTVWVDNGEVLVMRDGRDGDRFIALAADQKPLFWIYDWAAPMGEIYETNVDPYSINAYMYDEGVMLVEITVYYSNEKDGDTFATNAFLLYEKDGYAIDKAVNLGCADYLSNRDDIWYNTSTGFTLVDGQVSYHKWMFTAGDGVYYYEIAKGDDGTVYTIYTAYGDKVGAVGELVKGVVKKDAYVVHGKVNGYLKYKLVKGQ